jgi:hypothetical protein
MSTPNPEYDPDWQIKWRAAKFRVDTVGHSDNVSDMWTELEKRFPSLEEYHAAIIDRIHRDFPAAKPANDIFPFDPTMSPEDIRTKWIAIQETLKRKEWAAKVRDRERHGQPNGFPVFANPLAPGGTRVVQRIHWGGLHGRRMGVSKTIAICEFYETEAHICFLSAASVVSGTDPAVDDTTGRVQLPSVYFNAELADRYSPDQVRWYYYQIGDDFFDHVWFFRRANLEWQPARTERFLWRRREIPGDWFVRMDTSSNDHHFRSVPRIIGEAVLFDRDANLPIVELPDLRPY